MDGFRDVILNPEELKVLEQKKIAVIGCGGLGGYVLEMLARFGIGKIVVVDDDVFDAENINVQIAARYASLGEYKVNEAVLWIKQINPFIYVKGVVGRINKDNANKILKGVDMVFDCVDNVETKFILQAACEKIGIPLIHGAVEGWKGQVSTILPKDRTLDSIYKNDAKKIQKLDRPAYIPAVVASYQVSECIKFFLNKGEMLRDRVMHIDMLNNLSSITYFEKDTH